MASLNSKYSATPRLRSMLNKIATLLFFIVLLTAGWIAVSYFRAGISHNQRSTTASPRARIVTASTSSLIQKKDGASKLPDKPNLLVYSVERDLLYYHTLTHLPNDSGRVAIGDEVARRRGLKPCPVCIKH